MTTLLASTKSKKVNFFKSGDLQFSGHQVIINSRTFRTFDALLDALSKKVPLPFGVRNIKTPQGTHTIRSLDELHHGGIYVCSDRRTFKPLKLDEINQRHVPWNSGRSRNAGRRGQIRQLAKKNEVGRMENMTVRTPKKLVIFKNRDPSTKHIVAFQQRREETFECLLEYLSQVMQFPVVKVYTTDGKPVDGLPALTLCSGVIVAVGDEAFQQVNYNLQASSSSFQASPSVISAAPRMTQSVHITSRPSSRKISSSEGHCVNLINETLHFNQSEVGIRSIFSVNSEAVESEEMNECDFMPGVKKSDHLVIPSDDQVEKSFCVNQDGSMTMKMKVRLTIKQEEMIQWTTTLSRICVNSQEGNNSQQSTRQSNNDECEYKNKNTNSYKPKKPNKDRENHCKFAASNALKHPKPCYRRLPIQGPRLVRRKKTLVKNINCSEVQKTSVCSYSHLENTHVGELPEKNSVISHGSLRSIQPVQKNRRNLGATKHNKTHSSHLGMSDVLQLHYKENEITETQMHIHHSQVARPRAEQDSFKCMFKEKRNPDATEEPPQSLNNDCKTKLTKFPVSSGSLPLQSKLSQTKSTSNLYQHQTRCEFSDTRVKKSSKEASDNKRLISGTKARPSKSILDKQQNVISPNRLKKKKSQSNENRKTNHEKEFMDLSNTDMPKPQLDSKVEGIPSFYSSKSCSVYQYVENWMEVNHPETVPYMDETRARFQIEGEFSDISELRDESEKYKLERTPVCQPLVEIIGERHSAETHNLGRFSKSLPSVRIYTDKPKICTRKNKSLENLVLLLSSNTDSDTSPNTHLKPSSGKKQVLEQLHLPIRCSQSSLMLKKKSSSLPDFSLHFGSFLIMTTLRGETGFANADNSGVNPETLQVMKSIQKLSNLKNEEDLKANLMSLHNSDKIMNIWRNFQEKKYIKEYPPLPQDKGDAFYSQNRMKERDELSLLVGEYCDESNPTTHHDHENQMNKSALENKEGIINNGVGEKKERFTNETTSNDFTNTMTAQSSKDSEKIHILKSSLHKTTLQGIRKSDILKTVQKTETTNQKGQKQQSKTHFSENKQTMDNIQLIDDEKYKKHQKNFVDEIHVPDYRSTKMKNIQSQKYIDFMQSESESIIPASETTNPEKINDNVSKRGDCRGSFEGSGIRLKKELYDCETTKHVEKPDGISVNSETETEETHCPTNETIKIEQKKNIFNKICRSEASSLSADEIDPNINNGKAQMEVEINTDNKKTNCAKPVAITHHYSTTNQTVKQSESCKSEYYTQQEAEYRFENLKEESVIRRNSHNGNKKKVDKDEDFDSDPNYPKYLHQEGECSESSDLHSLDEENLGGSSTNPAAQRENKAQRLDLKLKMECHKDEMTMSHYSYLEDHRSSITDLLMRESGKRKDKHETQSKEEADLDHRYHYGHPTLLPQQLLDFVNLALMSSALIFTYDSNGFLRLEPDKCKRVSKNTLDNEYSRCLPSPNTSDLSDYRSDTSDSEESPSQFSTDLFTNSEEDMINKIYHGNINQSSTNINQEVKHLDNESKHYPNTKQISLPVQCETLGSFGNTEHAHQTFQTKTESEEGILIDKGRWLLKENHLICKSPSVPIGMYDDVDTTSVDTGHISDDDPCTLYGTQKSELALVSSTELEDMTKPPTPKCSYFNMVHSSDSDTFLDTQSITRNRGRGFSRKSREVSPLGETERSHGKKNGSLPSFSSVEFKLMAGKVHPAGKPPSSMAEKSGRFESLRCNPPDEEEAVEGLSLRCGKCCLIL